MLKNPFFSIIIPVSKSADRKLLNRCLLSLAKQDYKLPKTKSLRYSPPLNVGSKSLFTPPLTRSLNKGFEVILVEEAKSNLSKSEARNYGAKKARGKYLVHIDIDYVLHPTILKKCLNLIDQKQARTIILRENVAKPKNIWQKARKLEKEILSQNRFFSTPQVIEKTLFEKIGGFDEEVDALDDWVLNIKLAKGAIVPYEISSPLTTVYESTNIIEVIKRRFNKGRYLKPFKEKYGIVPQAAILQTLKLYWKHLYKSPTRPAKPWGSGVTLFTLIILKFFDLTAFYLGSLFPASPKHPKPKGPSFAYLPNLYNNYSVAQQFDREQNSLYARLKHYIEVKSLLNLLPNQLAPRSPERSRTGEVGSPITILELGCGTGRITLELAKKGYQVTPTDISPAMLKVYKTKIPNNPNLPNPMILKPGKLPYKDGSFDHVIAIRVIWHIADRKERELFLKEAIRVAKKSVIIDFAIKNRGLNRFYSKDYFYSKTEIEKQAMINNAKITSSKYLPLGRLLVKMSITK